LFVCAGLRPVQERAGTPRGDAPCCAGRIVPHDRLPVRCAVRPRSGTRVRARDLAERTPARSRRRALGRLDRTPRRARRRDAHLGAAPCQSPAPSGPHPVNPPATGRTRQTCEPGVMATRAWMCACAHQRLAVGSALGHRDRRRAAGRVRVCRCALRRSWREEEGEARLRKGAGRGINPN
jgi:hypothetical protein